MKPKIYATYQMSKDVKDYLEQYCEIKVWDESTEEIPREVLLEEVAEVDGLYTSSSTGGQIDEQLLQHAKNLKVISNVSVGYNNFDIEAMKKRNVIGTNTPSVLDNTVADLAFALILSAGRRVVELHNEMRAGNWNKETKYEDLFGSDVSGTTLGIIGMGRIGEAIAKRAKCGFDMDIIYHNRSRKIEAEKKFDAKYCSSMDELLEQSDYVLLMTPLTKETVHLIGAEQFKRMKKSAIFINVSRGQTVDEQALIQALQTGEIKAAGLDVFTLEPIEVDNPLLTLPNVVTTPHIGSATFTTEEAMAQCAAENIVAVLTGASPKNPVW